jgi:alkanesulfonate monooxygenase SsuD/methylene tetrahydromethanopterin reductase-like flavin-dependent oxidoreductase (luciferase family)
VYQLVKESKREDIFGIVKNRRQNMQIGIGFPAWIPQVSGSFLIDWARAADAGPFSSLGLIDRMVYANYEPLIALAGAAGATRRIRLVTTVLLAPLREPALLAKQSASLDALSSGRLTLGLGVGAREDDFLATSTSFHTRGKRFDEQLALMERIRRLRRWGHGFMAGGGDPNGANQFFRLSEENWREAGRAGKPRLVGCAYFALGENAAERAPVPILRYYSFAPERAQRIAGAIPSSPEKVRGIIQAYKDIGTDELILWPTIPELDQIARLADIIGG